MLGVSLLLFGSARVSLAQSCCTPVEECPIPRPCDYPSARDAAIPGSTTEVLTVNTAVHVFCTDGGFCWQDPNEIDEFMCLVNEDYEPWKIQFDYEVYFHNDTAAFDPNTTANLSEVVKDVYALSPDSTFNIFVTWHPSFAVFPWQPVALAARGGVVLDSFPNQGLLRRIPTHEIGHALGLFHIFRGDELGCENGCYEYVEMDAEDRDVVGDFCSDTMPVPAGWAGCTIAGDDCEDTPWTDDSVGNWMSYTDDLARLGEFTEQQAGRMHCWTSIRVWGWVCYGDADQDLDVDDDDYDLVYEELGLEGDYLTTDLNKDGIVDEADLNIAAAEWGKDCTGGTTPCSN